MDYLTWRGDLPFEAVPAGVPDYFICSQLATPDYAAVVGEEPVLIAQAAEEYFERVSSTMKKTGVLQSEGVLPMLKVLGSYPRYQRVSLRAYRNSVDLETVEQFSAVTVDMPDGTMCVCFRGTDDTFAGWQEDFNFSLEATTPAQKDAVAYLNEVASGYCGDVVVCGHSKGGHLAVYAAAMADPGVQMHIAAVYSFDGPGFREEFVQSAECRRIEDRVTTVLSQHSTVGLLLKGVGRRKIVHSRVSGPMAHDGFNWEVLGADFVEEPELSTTSKAFEKAMAQTLESMDQEERKAFIEEFFGSFESTGADTITDFMKLKPGEALEFIKTATSGKRTGSFLRELMEQMLRELVQNEEKVIIKTEQEK